MNILKQIVRLVVITAVGLFLLTTLVTINPAVQAAPMEPTYDCTAQTDIPQGECEALVAIYEANPNGNFGSGWGQDGISPCSWNGVTCSGNVVTELDMEYKQVTIMPAEIGQLSNLQRLYWGVNYLIALPPEIGQLSNLVELDLNFNDLTALPPEIGQLHNLRRLDLDANYLRANVPKEIGQLSNLTQLILSRNVMNVLLPEIGQLSSLELLRLDGNFFKTLPTEIGQLSNLRVLSLDSNQLTAIPIEIGQLNNLRDLSFFANHLTAVPTQIGQLANLRTLGLGYNQLTDVPTEIGQLANLQRLYLNQNQLTTVPSELGQLNNLERLNLSDNPLTAVPYEIWQLTKLQALSLNGNQIVALPPEIGQLSNLQELALDNNQLTTLPPEIGQLSNLEELSLENNLLTTLPPEIGQLGSLHVLNLGNNQLPAVSTEISNLTSLWQLYLDNNSLEGPIPNSLTTLNISFFSYHSTNWCMPPSPSTVQAWLNSIQFVFGTGRVCGQPAGSLSGQVTASETFPITQTTVTLYRQILVGWPQERIVVDTTYPDVQGNYSFDDLGQEIDYFVQFTPPLGSGLAPQYYDGQGTIDMGTPITVTLGMTTTNINATLAPAQPPLATVTSSNGSVTTNPVNGMVIVAQRNGNTSDLTVTRTVLCDDDSIPSAVNLMFAGNKYAMSATGKANEYSATIPATEITRGALEVVATCGDNDEITWIGMVTLHDPSGFITDSVTNAPIVGATVTLYQVPNWQAKTGPQDTRPNTCQSNNSKAEGEAWNQPAPTELGVLVNTDVTTVSPLINQQTTDNEGYYGWDVPSGCWYVMVTAEGYEPLTSPVVGVPTEVTDLDLQLTPLVTTRSLYLPIITR